MKRYAIVAAAAMLVFAASAAEAQWPRGKGKGYLQASIGHGSADRGYDADGVSGPLGSAADPQKYEESGLYLYGEYGLGPRLTVIGSTYAKRLEVSTATDRTQTKGVADLMIKIRYAALQRGNLVVSTEGGLRVPTGYDEAAAPPLGSGEFDVTFGVSSGLSLHPTPGYISSSLGMRLRGGIVTNEIYAHVEGGVFPHPKLLLRGRLDLIESTSDKTTVFDVMTQVTEQGYLTVGPGVSVLATKSWQIHADARWTVKGRTTSKIGSVGGGVAYLW